MGKKNGVVEPVGVDRLFPNYHATGRWSLWEKREREREKQKMNGKENWKKKIKTKRTFPGDPGLLMTMTSSAHLHIGRRRCCCCCCCCCFFAFLLLGREGVAGLIPTSSPSSSSSSTSFAYGDVICISIDQPAALWGPSFLTKLVQTRFTRCSFVLFFPFFFFFSFFFFTSRLGPRKWNVDLDFVSFFFLSFFLRFFFVSFFFLFFLLWKTWNFQEPKGFPPLERF